MGLTFSDVLNCNFTRREQVDSGDGAISYGHKTLACVYINTGEGVEVIKDSSVRSTHSKLDLGELRKDTKESHLGLGHNHLSIYSLATLVGKHICLSNLIF